MSSDNHALDGAKERKRDEFYTLYKDAAAELSAYPPGLFHGMAILCPCDGADSAFTRWFTDNYRRLGLRRLVCTQYAAGGHGRLLTYDGLESRTRLLDGDGDFRSPEVTRLRGQADFIVTNPPFSLFTPFLRWVLDSGRHYILVANKNAITYRSVFPLLRTGRMHLGATPLGHHTWYRVPDGYLPWLEAGKPSGSWRRTGEGLQVGVPSCWLTDLPHGGTILRPSLHTMEWNLRHDSRLRARLKALDGCPDTYPRYDNFDGIEVPYSRCIPTDYDGVMGVPISFMSYYDPNVFRLIGTEHGVDGDGGPRVPGGTLKVDGRSVFKRMLVQWKGRG